MTEHKAPSPSAPVLSCLRDKMAAADAVFRARLGAVSSVVDVVALARDMLSLCAEVAAALAALAPVKPLACRAGCDTCCRNLITVRPMESIEAEFGLEQGAVFLDSAARILVTTLGAPGHHPGGAWSPPWGRMVTTLGATERWLAGDAIFSEPEPPRLS